MQINYVSTKTPATSHGMPVLIRTSIICVWRPKRRHAFSSPFLHLSSNRPENTPVGDRGVRRLPAEQQPRLFSVSDGRRLGAERGSTHGQARAAAERDLPDATHPKHSMGLPVRTAEKRPGVVPWGVNGAAYIWHTWSVWAWDCQSGLLRNGQGWCQGVCLGRQSYGSPMECMGLAGSIETGSTGEVEKIAGRPSTAFSHGSTPFVTVLDPLQKGRRVLELFL